MKIILILCLHLLTISPMDRVVAIRLTGRCGYPGKPYRSKLEPEKHDYYMEGEEVSYQCLNFWAYEQTRRCERGKWIGDMARCGEFVNDTALNYVRVDDISDLTRAPVTKFEYDNMTLSDGLKIPSIFHTKRFTQPLRVFNDHKHRWTLRFTKSTIKLFLKINFNFINYSYLSREEQMSLRLDVGIRVSPYRTCRLSHQNDGVKWLEEGLKIDSYFICDSNSLDDYDLDIKDPPNEMTVETQASLNITHDLIALYFAKAFGTPNEPICGQPEVPFGLTSGVVTPDVDYSVVCTKDRNWQYVSSSSPDIPGTTIHKQRCATDMRWNGSYAECLPRKPCPVEDLLVGSNAGQTLISSISDVYHFNATHWYAIEGSIATYGCIDSSADIPIGRETRTCLKNGTWSGDEAQCYKTSGRLKFRTILVLSILVIAILVVILKITVCYVYNKRIKRGIRKQFTEQAVKSLKHMDRYGQVGYDDYDDISLTGHETGKDIYHMYQTVDETEEKQIVGRIYEHDYLEIKP